MFSSAAAKRLRHTLYVEVSRFSQPLEGGFGEQLLRKVYPPLAGGTECNEGSEIGKQQSAYPPLAGVARSAGGGPENNLRIIYPPKKEN